MTEPETLLRQILEGPADDVVRLVYADRVEESGRPWDAARAALIRSQVWLHRNPSCASCTGDEWLVGKPCAECDEREQHRDRVPALLKKWGAKWLPPVARKVIAHQFCRGYRVTGPIVTLDNDMRETDFTFEGGFIARARVVVGDGSKLPRYAPLVVRQLFAAHPIREITFVVEHQLPQVAVRLRTDSQGLWYATVSAGDEGAGTTDLRSRRELARQLAPFLARELSQIEFAGDPIPF